MAKSLTAALGLLALLILTSSQEASACETCKLSGIICNADECNEVYTCNDVHIGNGGSNDCYVDYYGCTLSGGPCQWAASKIFPILMGKNQFLASISHAANS
jgi:hypothetical protein